VVDAACDPAPIRARHALVPPFRIRWRCREIRSGRLMSATAI